MRGRAVAVVALAAGLLAAGGVGETLERRFGVPLLTRLRGPVEAPDGAVLVALDGESAGVLGLRDSLERWPRDLLAKVIANIDAAGAWAIAVDLLLHEAREPEADAALAGALAASGRVVLAEELGLTRGAEGGLLVARVRPVPPLSGFAAAARAVAPSTLPGGGGVVDAFWTFRADAPETATLPAATLLVAALGRAEVWEALARTPEGAALGRVLADGRAEGAGRLVTRLRGLLAEDRGAADRLLAALDASRPPGIDDESFALARAALRLLAGPGSRLLLPYVAPGGMRRVSYHRVLAGEPDALARLAGRVIFVGASEPSDLARQDDVFWTALTGDPPAPHAGVEIAQTAYLNLLHDHAPRRLPAAGEGALVGLAALVAAGGALTASLPLSLLGAGLAGTGVVAGGTWLFGTAAMLVLPVASLLALGLAPGVTAGFLLRHRALRGSLDRAVGILTRGHARRGRAGAALDAWPGAAARERRWVVCLATDIASYLALTERLRGREAELATLLADYRGLVHETVERHGGYVADFAGDASMCLWEAEGPRPEVRVRAVRAALELARGLDRFAAERGAGGHVTRIGLAEGWAVLGNLDAEGRLTFGAVGAPLSVASRLEQHNKTLGTRILATAGVVEGLGGVADLRPVGRVALRGRDAEDDVVALEALPPRRAA